MATNGPACFYEISSLTRKSRSSHTTTPNSTWGISSSIAPLQLHVIRTHYGPEIMNVRNSVGPIRERILNRTQVTLRISVQKTRFCFIKTSAKERLLLCTHWRQRLWENWRYSSIQLQPCTTRGEWPAVCPSCGTHWIRSWVDTTAGVDTLQNSCPCQESKNDLSGVQPLS